MKILITGATGFIGRHLARRLLLDGHELTCLQHQSPIPQELESCSWVSGRYFDYFFTTSEKVDAIIHLAQAPGNSNFEDLFLDNVLQTHILAKNAQMMGVKFIFASTASIYGGGDKLFTEMDKPLVTEAYPLTKVAAELLCQDSFQKEGAKGLKILRICRPYGPNQKDRLVPKVFERVMNGQIIKLNRNASPKNNPVYIDDLVNAIANLLDSDTDGIFNIGGDEAVSVRQLAMIMGEVVGKKPIFEESDSTGEGDVVVDCSKLKKLGWKPRTSLNEGLLLMI